MTSPDTNNGRSPLLWILTILVLLQLGLTVDGRLRGSESEDSEQVARLQQSVDDLLGEVTRMRIEQTAKGKGPAALIEKLRVYAPLTSDARVTEPDYRNAKKEIAAIMRAYESLGEDAWQPTIELLEKLDPKKDFELVKWLLEGLVRIDVEPAKQLLKDVLLGQRLPHARLRWYVARMLTRIDKPLARQLLRRVLTTESSRGIDTDSAQKFGMAIPDPAAYATTGFHNFVQRYLETDDPDTEATLMMLLSRVEHDVVTVQECVKELGRRKAKQATKHIKRLYENPPHNQTNPLFLNHCLDAVYEIEGTDCRAWLEQMLPDAATDIIANKIKSLLEKMK